MSKLEKLKIIYGKYVMILADDLYLVNKNGNKYLINRAGNIVNIFDGTIEWIEQNLICISYDDYLIITNIEFNMDIRVVDVARSDEYFLAVKENEHVGYELELFNYRFENICRCVYKYRPMRIKDKGLRDGLLVFGADMWNGIKQNGAKWNGIKRIGLKHIVCNIKTGEISIEDR